MFHFPASYPKPIHSRQMRTAFWSTISVSPRAMPQAKNKSDIPKSPQEIPVFIVLFHFMQILLHKRSVAVHVRPYHRFSHQVSFPVHEKGGGNAYDSI